MRILVESRTIEAVVGYSMLVDPDPSEDAAPTGAAERRLLGRGARFATSEGVVRHRAIGDQVIQHRGGRLLQACDEQAVHADEQDVFRFWRAAIAPA